MSNPFESLLDVKGIKETLIFVFFVVVLLLVLTQLQQTPLGQNEQANKTLEEGKKSISVITEWYFIGGEIAGVIVLILLYRKFKNNTC